MKTLANFLMTKRFGTVSSVLGLFVSVEFLLQIPNSISSSPLVHFLSFRGKFIGNLNILCRLNSSKMISGELPQVSHQIRDPVAREGGAAARII